MRIIALALILSLGACGDGTDDRMLVEASDEQTASVPAPPQSASLALRPDGLSLLAVGTTQAEAITFGRPRAEVEEAVARAFPGVLLEQGENTECPGGPMQFSRYGPLSLNFQDDRLVGWFAREGVQAATIDGITPGITLADLERERSVQIPPNAGIEGMFVYFLPDGSEVNGFREGQGRNAKVSALYAGTICFFS